MIGVAVAVAHAVFGDSSLEDSDSTKTLTLFWFGFGQVKHGQARDRDSVLGLVPTATNHNLVSCSVGGRGN